MRNTPLCRLETGPPLARRKTAGLVGCGDAWCRQPVHPARRSDLGRPFEDLGMRGAGQMLAQEIAAEDAVEVAPDRVDVVGVVLGVVELDQERRALHAVIVLLAAFELP